MSVSRRRFIATTSTVAGGLILGCDGKRKTPATLPAAASPSRSHHPSIDRQAVVRRHNLHTTAFNPNASVTVGNGEFAFTADVTGLQTFLAESNIEFPLCTTAHWAWHSVDAPGGVDPNSLRMQSFTSHGRQIGYRTDSAGQKPLFNWLRQNPHRLHLGRIAFDLCAADGAATRPADAKNVQQTLDLWAGVIESRFDFEGDPVRVWTCCHPRLDMLAVRVESPRLAAGRLRVLFAFPYGSHEVNMADWNAPARHQTRLVANDRVATFERTLDHSKYCLTLGWSDGGKLEQTAPHDFALSTEHARLEFTAHFLSQDDAQGETASFDHVMRATAEHWASFWSEGGAIDFSASSDPRAAEIERRAVLSQYNTALHCAGSLPSAETGLLFNSWFGKFHLEMHWWHSVHFTAWDRFAAFERSMGYYQSILPMARELAKSQGFAGARWPKMVGPEGRDSPSTVGPLLIWQQPHPIYYAELFYRHRPTRKTLADWSVIVFETAHFLADYALFDRPRDQYVLPPPMKTVSENTDALATINPTFELTYWRFALRTAQTWRQRLGMPPEPRWSLVLQKLSPAPTQDSLYLLQEGMTDTYTKWNWEHPALIGALGMIPGDGIDAATMQRTARKVIETWQWERCWGWDFPMLAMCAARVNEPELAVRALLMDAPRNLYHPNGHNYQRETLTAYLPGNGAVLGAVAMMANGWTNSLSDAPGFPNDGKWSVKREGLRTWM